MNRNKDKSDLKALFWKDL